MLRFYLKCLLSSKTPMQKGAVAGLLSDIVMTIKSSLAETIPIPFLYCPRNRFSTTLVPGKNLLCGTGEEENEPLLTESWLRYAA